jgi:hypothetical protein
VAHGTYGRFIVAAFALSACGGELAPFADEAGSTSPVDGGDSGKNASQVNLHGYCVYQTCGGISDCAAGQTCPVGDGCNTCACAEGPRGTAGALTCTQNSCFCP